MQLGRRDVLAALGAAALPGTAAGAPANLPLGQLAAQRGILLGAYIRGPSLTAIPAYGALMASEFNLVVSALEMHWSAVAPTPDQTVFTRPDMVAAWAASHRKQLRGHALVWHRQLPPWLGGLPTRESVAAALQDHVRTMCAHFAGRISSWDVVNEALQPQPTLSRPMRASVIADALGPAFIDIAFRTARATDPRAQLVYNDYGVEMDVPPQRLKQEVLLRFVDDARRRGIPIDAVGVQSHLSVEMMQHFNPKQYGEFLASLAGLGVKILLTELDVADRGAPADSGERDQVVASIYRRYLDVALANPAVTTVVTWGLADNDSWVTRGDMPLFIRADSLPPRPLLFDAAYQPKASYAAVAAALASAARR